jgi:hypothetical protein
MTQRRPQHPSGRPIRRPHVGVSSIWRIPGSGPVTPGLQREEPTNAIGFMADLVRPFPQDDDE